MKAFDKRLLQKTRRNIDGIFSNGKKEIQEETEIIV